MIPDFMDERIPPIVTFNAMFMLTIPVLRLISSNAQGRKYLWKPSKPYLVGIHWIALAEYSQMSTNLVSVIFRIFESFCIGQSSHQQRECKVVT